MQGLANAHRSASWPKSPSSDFPSPDTKSHRNANEIVHIARAVEVDLVLNIRNVGLGMRSNAFSTSTEYADSRLPSKNSNPSIACG
jgi:hypothetical protein